MNATHAQALPADSALPVSLFPPGGPIEMNVQPPPSSHAGLPSLGIVITIDGPAGTGKSSVARVLAKRLGLDFLDTGAMYRAAAAIAIDRGLLDAPVAEFVREVENARVRFDWTKDPPMIIANDRPLATRIRQSDVTGVVSRVASIAPLRKLMVQKQRRIAADHPRLVTEGRDQGSVVFPHAPLKVFLFADAMVRAKRRAEQLAIENPGAAPMDLERLRGEIEARDRSDASRADGPLVEPEGAERVDTSALTFDQVVDRLEALARSRLVLPTKQGG